MAFFYRLFAWLLLALLAQLSLSGCAASRPWQGFHGPAYLPTRPQPPTPRSKP